MKLKFISCILSVLLISCDECNDDPMPPTELEKLPPVTQAGKNTFGCLVDGRAWVHRNSIDAMAFYQEGVLLIAAFNEAGNVDQGMSIYIYDENLSEREYHLSDKVD